MHIVMFCINPLFPSQTMGGATKHLKNIACHLGKLGHDVTILATRREDTSESFRWHDRVEVLPLLQFHQPFPQPYATPAHNLATIIQDVGEYLQKADRFYMHDGEFLFPYVYQHVPTVVSLRDVVYPETLQGAFLFQGYQLIVISEYARACFQQTVGRFFPGLKDRLRVIHNGIDWDYFRPTTPQRILEIVPVDPSEDTLILHPHRPEPSKGIWETIRVVDLLVHQHGLRDVKTLVPKWLDTGLSPALQAFYGQMEQEIDRLGLQQNFVFHEWIPQDLMPEYYSLGAVTLSLGNFVEAFGNSVYESLGCGTPSVVARVSTHREILPEHLVDKVDYGDVHTAAHIAARIIREKRRTGADTLAYLRHHYSARAQLDRYATAILEARLVDQLGYQLSMIDDTTRFALAAWCYAAEQGFYHDFRANYCRLDQLAVMLQKYKNGFTLRDAEKEGLRAFEVERWYRDGYIVPRVG